MSKNDSTYLKTFPEISYWKLKSAGFRNCKVSNGFSYPVHGLLILVSNNL